MTQFKTLSDILQLKGKAVLVRMDMNVPIQNGIITDTSRIDRIKPTLDYLTRQGAKVVLMSHLGRPQGKVDPEFSLKLIAKYLCIPLNHSQIGEQLNTAVAELGPGQVMLMENIRYYAGEESNDPELAKALAKPFDIYVNDAFSVSHRAHMSVEAIAHELPAYAGLLMEEELKALRQALTSPEHPVMAIVGGAKVSTKLRLLENLTQKVDMLVIGGAMANTFLLAQGYDVGASLVEPDLCETAQKILQQAPCEILLPVDVIVANELSSASKSMVQPVSEVGSADMILDAGPETVAIIEAMLNKTKTVVINGPLGVFETPPFDLATVSTFKTIARLTQSGGLVSVAGGGDTVAALKHAGVESDLTYVSTAGGAFLEWLEGRTLPGVEALTS